jgi:hypothetical protein
VRAKLDAQERAVLAHLFVEVYELLDDGVQADPDPLAALVGIGTSVDPPDDPALARLLPDAHKEDPEASSEFRRYTEQGLRQRKRQALETARLALGRDGALTLDDPEQQAWLVALTDVRLVLAERMGLRTEEDHERLMDALGVSLDSQLDDDLDDDLGAASEGAAGDAGEQQADGGDAAERAGDPTGGDRSPGTAGPGSASDTPGRLDDDQRVQLATMLSLYDFLTWLQETLVQAVCDD